VRFTLSLGAILLAASTVAVANPWDDVPRTPPHKKLADAVKANSQPGQPSALNPSCEGMTGDACTKSARELDKSRPAYEEASKTPPPPKR